MNFTNLNTYNESYDRSFEALCNQLFERWVRREYKERLKYFATVRGDGGDGGVEAYAILTNEDIVAVQSKWFPFNIANSQVNQIRKSVASAKKVRPGIKKYIICLPKNLTSLTARNKTKSNSEEGRLNKLKEEAIKQFSDLELVFWDEHTLRKQLQESGNEGINRFWFEQSELSQESIYRKFELEKEGWLNERYISELHLSDAAEWEIEKALFTPKARMHYIKFIEKSLGEISSVNTLIDEFNRKISGHNINLTLTNISDNLKEFEIYIYKIKNIIWAGSYALPPFLLKEVYIWDVKLDLEVENYGNTNKNLQEKLSSALENVHQIDLKNWLKDLSNYIAPHNLMLMGEPGTGKTHTLAYVIEQRLKQNLPAIIIQANNSPCESWLKIFQYALGGLNSWTFEQICSALEALASRADSYNVRHRKDEDIPDELSAVIIAIDGIDEAPSRNYSEWRIRINELKAVAIQFPRLRFLISCRTYGIQNRNPLNLDFDDIINRRFELTDGLLGDSPGFNAQSKTEHLTVPYFSKYNIVHNNLPWLKGAFRTPLELKLFCENYKSQDITQIVKPIHTTLKFLLSTKISRLEREFIARFETPWSRNDQVFKKALVIIAEIFMELKEEEHDTLCQVIRSKSNEIIDRNWAGKILEFVADHGLLFHKKLLIDEIIGIEQITYKTTYRSYIDYLIALKAASEIGQGKIKSLPHYLAKNNQNVLNLTAIYIFNDYNILIGEDGYWTKDFDEAHLHFMQYQALAEGSTEQIKSRLPILEERFKASRSDRASILQSLVLPLTGNQDLHLEKSFIHRILSSFSNSFERDLIWSGDECFYDDPENIPTPSDILRRVHHLEKWHKHEERPLLFAWGLSCLDNYARKHFRKELTKWGAWNIHEFIKLLDIVFFCKDPQIQEDLATVALGIASLIRTPGNGLKELGRWMLQNIFDEKGTIQILNSVVRYGARAVVERSFQLGEITSTEVQKGRPVYCHNHELLLLDLSVLTEHLSYPFGNDLDWYVIGQSYKGFLDYGFQGKFDSETEKFLKPYHQKYNTNFGPNEWSKAAAKSYIQSLGFNRLDGSTMTKETHGSVSEVMTFEEKYVWLSVHQIQGYLADLVLYKGWGGARAQIVEDYSHIVYVPNPIAKQMLMTTTEVAEFGLTAQIRTEGEWFIPEEIAPELTRSEKELKEDILNWVNTPQQPDFKKWIETGSFFKNTSTQEIKTGTTLYGYLSLAESKKLGRTSLDQICFLMDEDLHEKFVHNFKDHLESLWHYFEDLNCFEARTESIYFSPEDLVWMDWVKETSSKIEISLPSLFEKPFNIINNITKVTDDDVTDGENYYHIPSKFLRQELGIVNMGYRSFFDLNEHQVAWSIKSGKPFYDSQEFVFVDSKKFSDLLKRNQLKPVWVFFQFKSTSAEFKEKYKESHAQNCKLWIVWEEDGKYEHQLYHDGWFRNP